MKYNESKYLEQVDQVTAELNRHLDETINEGTLSQNVIGSKIHLMNLSMTELIILVSNMIGETLTDDQLKELASLSYFTILSIKNNDEEAGRVSDLIYKKYEHIILKCRTMHDEIIKSDYSDYGFNNTTTPTSHGAVIPLNWKRFLEKYRALFPLGFPQDSDEYVSIMDKIAKASKDKEGSIFGVTKVVKDQSPKKHQCKIPTLASQKEILDFWFILLRNNQKGEPYWIDKSEIEHFVYQNFKVFPGVEEIKRFNPNMNKTELYHVTWTFFYKYGMGKTKRQYVSLLVKNFTKFNGGLHVYSNIKDQNIKYLKELFK